MLPVPLAEALRLRALLRHRRRDNAAAETPRLLGKANGSIACPTSTSRRRYCLPLFGVSGSGSGVAG